MKKAVLVIDMPESCCNCPMNFWNNCGVLDAKKKFSGRIEKPSTERLKDCPLKLLPEKYETDKNKCSDPFYQFEFEYGYNQCIDEIVDK